MLLLKELENAENCKEESKDYPYFYRISWTSLQTSIYAYMCVGTS